MCIIERSVCIIKVVLWKRLFPLHNAMLYTPIVYRYSMLVMLIQHPPTIYRLGTAHSKVHHFYIIQHVKCTILVFVYSLFMVMSYSHIYESLIPFTFSSFVHSFVCFVVVPFAYYIKQQENKL